MACLSPRGEKLPYASAYARIFVGSCILNVLNVIMNTLVTSEGTAKTALCALLTGPCSTWRSTL